MVNRRTFLIGTGCLGISAAVTPAQVTTSESAKQTLSGKKLVPPVNGMIKVACALSKDVTPIDWVGPQAVFGAWLHDESLKQDRPLFEVFTVGESRQPIDQWLIPDYTYEDAPPAQVIVIPAQSDSPQFYEWLKKANKGSDVTMSVCIGARHLAKLGLLDGQVATTHHDFIKPFLPLTGGFGQLLEQRPCLSKSRDAAVQSEIREDDTSALLAEQVKHGSHGKRVSPVIESCGVKICANQVTHERAQTLSILAELGLCDI